MSGIFDNITVSGALPISAGPQGAQTPPQSAAGMTPGVETSTGLVAAINSTEFERIVKLASSAVVLRTSARLSSETDKRKSGAPAMGYRYVVSLDGIVFVTTSGSPLSLPETTHQVNCLAVLYGGRPLGRDDNSF